MVYPPKLHEPTGGTKRQTAAKKRVHVLRQVASLPYFTSIPHNLPSIPCTTLLYLTILTLPLLYIACPHYLSFIPYLSYIETAAYTPTPKQKGR